VLVLKEVGLLLHVVLENIRILQARIHVSSVPQDTCAMM
jgi:hypothetical protein